MLTNLDFAEKHTIFVLERRRGPQTLGFSPFFLVKNGKKTVVLPQRADFFSLRSDFFLEYAMEISPI